MNDQPNRAARRAAEKDAKQRSIRTLAQGLAVDVLIAAGAGATAVLSTWDNNDVLAAASWVVLGTAVVKSVLTAAASYIARLQIPPKE